MRSDFWSLPHAARRAIRKGERDARRAASARQEAHSKDAEIAALKADLAEARKVIERLQAKNRARLKAAGERNPRRRLSQQGDQS